MDTNQNSTNTIHLVWSNSVKGSEYSFRSTVEKLEARERLEPSHVSNPNWTKKQNHKSKEKGRKKVLKRKGSKRTSEKDEKKMLSENDNIECGDDDAGRELELEHRKAENSRKINPEDKDVNDDRHRIEFDGFNNL